MYKVNDYVMNRSAGVCQITDIKIDEAMSNEIKYYVLHPVYQNNMTIKIPVHNANVLLRPVLTKDEALSLIATMPDQEPFSINDTRERCNIFKTALRTCNHEELIKIIKTLYLEKQAKSAVNKRLTKTDENIMDNAEKQLHEEFAIALNISPDEVVPYITEYISHLGEYN